MIILHMLIKYHNMKNKNVEGHLIEITEGGLIKPAIVDNIYRPPRDLSVNYKQYIEEFSLLLSQLG